jgi:flagellar basal-body rod protein FlgG
MYKGIYIALSGATLKQTQIDLISQNLANSSTPGYKKDKISFQDYLVSQMNGMLQPPDGRTMSDISSVNTDFSNGSLIKTGNMLDIAVDGSGFISLEGNRYTRRGDLRLDSEGYLVNKSGIKVLGKNGPIQISGNGAVEIGNKGDISVNGIQIDTIKIVDFQNNNAIKKTGEDYFITDQKGVESKAAVKQSYIETSNVDIVKEMVQMITALREFQTYQKAIQAFDDATSKVTNDMGRI